MPSTTKVTRLRPPQVAALKQYVVPNYDGTTVSNTTVEFPAAPLEALMRLSSIVAVMTDKPAKRALGHVAVKLDKQVQDTTVLACGKYTEPDYDDGETPESIERGPLGPSTATEGETAGLDGLRAAIATGDDAEVRAAFRNLAIESGTVIMDTLLIEAEEAHAAAVDAGSEDDAEWRPFYARYIAEAMVDRSFPELAATPAATPWQDLPHNVILA